MSINTHARCDWCEEVLFVDDESELLDEGWLTVCVGDEKRDFCCLPHLAKWSESPDTVELVESILNVEDEDG